MTEHISEELQEALKKQERKLPGIRRRASRKLNREILKTGMQINPSLNALILYGGLIDLTKQSLQILEANQIRNQAEYLKCVLPRIPDMMRALLGDKDIRLNIGAGKNWDIETLRGIVRKQYFSSKNGMITKEGTSKYIADQPTINALKGTTPLPSGHYPREASFVADLKHGYIFSWREKEVSKFSDKQLEKVNIVRGKAMLEEVYRFMLAVALDPNPYWRPDVRKQYLSEFSEKVVDTQVGDNLGIRGIILNGEQSRKTQNRIINRKRLSSNGFNILEERIEDHRYRTVDLKPGGIHITATEVGLHLPVEIQIYDLDDLVLDKFGPEAHHRYKPESFYVQ